MSAIDTHKAAPIGFAVNVSINHPGDTAEPTTKRTIAIIALMIPSLVITAPSETLFYAAQQRHYGILALVAYVAIDGDYFAFVIIQHS
jgi:hypothetical protein